jgi:hypothetical protein
MRAVIRSGDRRWRTIGCHGGAGVAVPSSPIGSTIFSASTAELVLDGTKQWKECRFEPVDAVQFAVDGGRMVGTVSSDVPAGGTPLKGGWDHEHCEICWATISLVDDSIAMFSEPDHWVCCSCYQQFIVPQSLGFIVDGQ